MVLIIKLMTIINVDKQDKNENASQSVNKD